MTQGIDLAGTRLIILRHGNTDWNAGGRFQGQIDIPLNDLGLAQAEKAAARLAEREPDALVSSDLRRAAQTADALGQRLGLPVHRDARLRERSFGLWEGLSREEVAERYPAGWEAWRHGEPLVGDGIEATGDVVKRAGEALTAAAERAPGGLVVAATHGGTAKHALAALLGWSEEVLGTVTVLGNCHWTELINYAGRGWRLVGHNNS